MLHFCARAEKILRCDVTPTLRSTDLTQTTIHIRNPSHLPMSSLSEHLPQDASPAGGDAPQAPFASVPGGMESCQFRGFRLPGLPAPVPATPRTPEEEVTYRLQLEADEAEVAMKAAKREEAKAAMAMKEGARRSLQAVLAEAAAARVHAMALGCSTPQ